MIEPSTFADAAIGTIKFYLPYELGRYLASATLMTLIVWLIRKTPWRTRQIQGRRSTSKDFTRELSSSIATCFVYLLTAIPTSWATHQGILAYPGETIGLSGDAMILVLMVLGHDAYFYWTHRAMHHPLLFKHFHRFHHRSVTPTPFTAYAFAAPEAIVNALFIPLWLALVPTPGLVTFAFLTAQIVRNVTAHAGVELHPSWWMRNPLTRWISTTTHHDLHHGGGFNSNYGFWFTFWDKAMGTEHPEYRQTFDRVVARSTDRDALPQLGN
jgi:Delta7-sterol 5-desaturase